MGIVLWAPVALGCVLSVSGKVAVEADYIRPNDAECMRPLQT